MGFLKRIWDDVTFQNLGNDDASGLGIPSGIPTANDFREMTPSQPFVYTPPAALVMTTETTFRVGKPLRLMGSKAKSTLR